MRCSDWQYIQEAGWCWKCVCNSFFALKVILSVQVDGKASCASIWGKELKKSGLIRFIVTFFIFGYKHQVIAELGRVLDIDRSADLGIENSPSQWNKTEKQHIKNHQMKRLFGLSELLCVLRPVLTCCCEKSALIHLLHPNHGANKLTHKHQVLPYVSSPISQTRTCNPSASLISRSHRWSLIHPASPFLQQQSAAEQWSSCRLQTKDVLQLPSRKKDALMRKPEHSDLPFPGECLSTHTYIRSTLQQSAIKFTQLNHVYHQKESFLNVVSKLLWL